MLLQSRDKAGVVRYIVCVCERVGTQKTDTCYSFGLILM